MLTPILYTMDKNWNMLNSPNSITFFFRSLPAKSGKMVKGVFHFSSRGILAAFTLARQGCRGYIFNSFEMHPMVKDVVTCK
jgi:hypothetical protein